MEQSPGKKQTNPKTKEKTMETLHHALREMMQFPIIFFSGFKFSPHQKKKKKKKKKLIP
jgi:hypothetical protein